MLNYWWVTRPKRKLNSVPEVLTVFSQLSLDQIWNRQSGLQLTFESKLEESGLKKIGERRDQTGGGGRTYKAWLISLGLIFKYEKTNEIKLTLAGESIIAGDSPVLVIRNQILKYQFPSSFSISKGVDVNRRFKIRPFRFLLRLLSDERIGYLTEEEIAKIIIVEAENETKSCFESVVNRILRFRESGDNVLQLDFFELFSSSKNKSKKIQSFDHLFSIANTFVNWLDYTQLISRNNGEIRIFDDRKQYVLNILSEKSALIDRPENHEYFQRKYGVDNKHTKDTRDLSKEPNITSLTINENQIKNEFIKLSTKLLITKIDFEIANMISIKLGLNLELVERVLIKHYPYGAIGGFMSNYFEMAFRGRDNAIEFEKATNEIFSNIFKYNSTHVGAIGLTPDILLWSEEDDYQAIIDNKAYSDYSITNDHKNRMLTNYIMNIDKYSKYNCQLAFFTYIAGGFNKNINTQLNEIVSKSGISGSVINVVNFIRLVEIYQIKPINHRFLKTLFSLNRQILASDLNSIA